MILFSGYSTMPVAPAALSCGMMWRTMFSSMIVLIAIHCLSESDEIGGFGNDAKVIRLERASRFGHVDDRVGQPRRFHLGGAPAKLDVRLDAVLSQPALGDADQLGGDPLALQILDALDRRIVRHREHPAH